MTRGHQQVPVRGFTADEEIAELIALLNDLGIETLLSCQDNNGGRGTARRAWVCVYAEDLPVLASLLDDPAEAKRDAESLSNRIVPGWEPDDWQEFRENRCWHYEVLLHRDRQEVAPPEASVRFPFTDVPEVTARLRQHAERERRRAAALETVTDENRL